MFIRTECKSHEDDDTARMDCGFAELKFAGADEKDMTFSGYGAVFGNVDSYGDVIVKGAFKDSITRSKRAKQWPAMLMQHGGSMFGGDPTPIGIWTDMYEDDTGLYVEGKLAPTARGIEAYQLMKMEPRPAINGLSIGYLAKEWSVRTKPDDPRRTLKAVELVEVSLVTNPANPKARVQAVKTDLTIRDAEKALRDVGFSQSDAKAIVATGFKALPQRDVEGVGDLLASLKRSFPSLLNT
jgi:HK97 family phage prohead protease